MILIATSSIFLTLSIVFKSKIHIVLILVLGVLQSIVAQENQESDQKKRSPKEYFLIRDLGVFNHKVKDLGASPLIYGGPGLHIHSGMLYYNENVFSSFQIGGHASLIAPKLFPEDTRSFAGAFRLNLNYEFLLRALKEKESWQFYVGPSLIADANMRVHALYSNNIMNYDGILGLGLNTFVRKYLGEDHRFSIDHHLSLPVYSLVIRPEYTLPFYFNASTQMIGTLVYIDSKTQLSYYLKNGNVLQLGYDWLFYQIKEPNKVQNGLSGIHFTSLFNF